MAGILLSPIYYVALQGTLQAFAPLFPDWSHVSFPMIPAISKPTSKSFLMKVYCSRRLNLNIYEDKKKHYN